MKSDWRPLCFSLSAFGTWQVAAVVCRELGCGAAIDVDNLRFKSPDAIGTPNCTGDEERVAQCPLSSLPCNQGTLNVVCSGKTPSRNLTSSVPLPPLHCSLLQCSNLHLWKFACKGNFSGILTPPPTLLYPSSPIYTQVFPVHTQNISCCQMSGH